MAVIGSPANGLPEPRLVPFALEIDEPAPLCVAGLNGEEPEGFDEEAAGGAGTEWNVEVGREEDGVEEEEL